MPTDNTEQLEAELFASEAEAEAEELAISRQEDILEQLNQIRDETLEQLEITKSETQEDIDEIKTDTSMPKWSTSPLIILAATSVIKPEATIMNIIATVGGGAVTLTSNPSIVDGVNGQVLVLRGSSATDTITLTDGNGMLLAGNRTLALNDTLTLYFDGIITNDWVEIARSTNG